MKQSLAESIVTRLLEDGNKVDWKARLHALRVRRGEDPATGRVLKEDANLPLALPIVFKDKVIPRGTMICPHCEQEIHEKHTYSENGKDFHSDCGGMIEFPAPSAEDQAYFQQHWGGALDTILGKDEAGGGEPTTMRV